MNIYKEIKKLASLNAKREHLIETINRKYGDLGEGVDWNTARFVSLSKEDIQSFRDSGDEDDDYFVSQSTGWTCDDYYGHLWFKTDVPGQYVRVYFEC